MSISNKVKGVIIGGAISALAACGGASTMYSGPLDGMHVTVLYDTGFDDYTEVRIDYDNGDRLHLRDDDSNDRLDRIESWQNGIHSTITREQAEGTPLIKLFSEMEDLEDKIFYKIKHVVSDVGN